ncbi:putative transcription factor Trihelix family [Helianthus anomalus]
MDKNGIFSSPLGLEISLNHHQQNPNFHHRQPPFAGAGTGTTAGAAVKQPYPYVHKQRASPISDEEVPATTTTDDSGGAGDGKLRQGSPWQRMKWTDNMVRLLIMVVFYVGDEVWSDQVSDTAAKKKGGGGGGGGGVMQKKGKWKSVSKAMMEKGFYVSPQQCEDKFNDLNKRYKRVNEILGKGVACKVVENNSLLETMDHIPLKLKEEVKKLLNSKHLFFREMCAYHNTCGGGVGGGGGGGGGGSGVGVGVGVARPSPPLDATASEHPGRHRQKYVHSNDEEDEENDDEDGDDDDEEDDGLSKRKRSRMEDNDGYASVIRQFNGELSSVIQDLTKSVWEKRQWMKVKRMQLEEQRVGFEGETYELEKRRLRWVKFCWSREREMELEKVRNERMKLENERMVILLRQKERELVNGSQ